MKKYKSNKSGDLTCGLKTQNPLILIWLNPGFPLRYDRNGKPVILNYLLGDNNLFILCYPNMEERYDQVKIDEIINFIVVVIPRLTGLKWFLSDW